MQSRTQKCHPERSEGSLLLIGHVLRFADTNRRPRCLYVSRRKRHERKPQSRLFRPFKIRIFINAFRHAPARRLSLCCPDSCGRHFLLSHARRPKQHRTRYSRRFTDSHRSVAAICSATVLVAKISLTPRSNTYANLRIRLRRLRRALRAHRL